MTTFDRFDPFGRRIGEALDGLAPLRRPDYLDDVLRQTARTQQRPRWSFPERWLPVALTARPSLLADGVQLRAVLLLALAALLATAALIGSRLLDQPAPTVPAPFGPARNGLVAFSVGSNLYLGDPAEGGGRLIAEGVGNNPMFDRTGTRIATAKRNEVGNAPCYGPPPVADCTVTILITDTTGTSSVITPAPLPWPGLIRDWSADGRWLLLNGAENALLLVATDGSGTRDVGVATNQIMPRFAPPATTSIWTDELSPDGLRPIRIGLDGRVLDRYPGLPAHENLAFDASPDGQRFAVAGAGSIVTVARIDGSVLQTIDLGQGIGQIVEMAWSPDAASLLVETLRGVDHRVAIVTLKDPSESRWLNPPAVTACRWSPDAASLVCSDGDVGWWRIWLSGASTQLGWPGSEIAYPPSWQRLPVQVAP